MGQDVRRPLELLDHLAGLGLQRHTLVRRRGDGLREAARWKRAMATSAKAVPDITDLLQAAGEALDEADEPDDEMRFGARRPARAEEAERRQPLKKRLGPLPNTLRWRWCFRCHKRCGRVGTPGHSASAAG